MNRGFSIIEILIAMAIGIIVISGVVAGSGGFSAALRGNQSTIMNGQTNAEAVTLAQKVLEQTQALGRQDFNLVNPTATTSIDGFYYKSVDVVTQPDFLTKLITTTISWLSDHNATSTTRFSTLVTNLENVNSPNLCNSTVLNANGWKTPKYYSFWTPDMLPPPHANGIAVSDLRVFDNKLYITASTTPNPSPESFLIFDLPVDPSQTPVLRGRIDNATSTNTGLNAVTVATTSGAIYAYVASAFPANFGTCSSANGAYTKCGQLQIIDVNDPDLSLGMAQIKYTFKVPSVTGTGGQSVGKSIFYKDGIVYLGLAKTPDTNPGGDTEFNAIDVGGGGLGGTPTDPKFIKGYQVGNGVNDIFVKGNYAYLASPNNENITIVDANISSPTFMQRVGGYTPPSGGNNGERVYTVGNTSYLGRAFGAKEFYILNVSSPSSVSLIGNALDIETGNQASVRGLAVKNNLAFIITRDQFQVWDIASPSSIMPWTPAASTTQFLQLSLLGGSGTSLNCDRDYFYIAIASSMGNNKDYVAIIVPGP